MGHLCIYRFMSRYRFFFFRFGVQILCRKFWGHFSPLTPGVGGLCAGVGCSSATCLRHLGWSQGWWDMGMTGEWGRQRGVKTKGENWKQRSFFVEGDGIDGMILSIWVFFVVVVVDEKPWIKKHVRRWFSWYQVSDKIQLIKNMLDKVRRTAWRFHWRSWKMFHT